ncbi:MAG: prephenate dehydrogenase [Eubacteriales bacterium]
MADPFFRIGIVGLGLIGASFAKSIKANTRHEVYAYDLDENVLSVALTDGCADGVLEGGNPEGCDIVFIALYPSAAVDYILRNALSFKKDCIVTDLCGVKRYVHSFSDKYEQAGIHFIGGHPMAGREKSGYAASTGELFFGASMLLTPLPSTPPEKVDILKELFRVMGFGRTIITTPEEHDAAIAYTSQLAHILSSSYVKSPASRYADGFSAGSFRDLTRVAFLNEVMWSELFLLNADALSAEIQGVIDRLEEYKQVIQSGDRAQLQRLLKEGSDIKSSLPVKK